jgi:hypothetical protein
VPQVGLTTALAATAPVRRRPRADTHRKPTSTMLTAGRRFGRKNAAFSADVPVAW